MALKIETFTNVDARAGWRPGNNFGGHSLFKALGHPKAAPLGRKLVADLAGFARLAVYDPEPQAGSEHLDTFYPVPRANLAGVFVQRVEDLGQTRLGLPTQPVTAIAALQPDAVLITAFDAQVHQQQIARLLPPGCQVFTLDAMRLPKEWLSNPARYLDPLNFATNFAFLREDAGEDGDPLHTQVVTGNYWSGYGAADPALWLCLFGTDGEVLAEWTEPLSGAFHAVVIDSRDVKKRFGLGSFAGSLFIHAIRIKGHDVVKYALDCFSESGRQLSCSHDANAWPADLYAGVPSPKDGERLLLWVQNSHPVAIPSGGLGVNIVGANDIAWWDGSVPPFGTVAVDLGKLLPQAKFPDQIEIQAGRYLIRPRYEIVQKGSGQNGSMRAGKRRIAHANVERTDLVPDPKLPQLGSLIGKGYIMPLPVLPLDQWKTVTLPTPMATAHRELPLRVVLYDADGSVAAEQYLGRLARRDSRPVDTDAWLTAAKAALPSGYGHVEYLYDFRDGGEGDGWLHALGLYEQRSSGHAAETIFGAHIYNMPITYRDEPQSYTHRPPGLTTRLFLRLGEERFDAICHLVYPASLPEGAYGGGPSQTTLTLFNGRAEKLAERTLAIPYGGSRFFRVSETFTAAERQAAGAGAWVQVRDTSCRLFGFHGLQNGAESFCIDHMFGF